MTDPNFPATDPQAVMVMRTTGDRIRSWLDALAVVRDEVILTADSAGLWVDVVDPANVLMATTHFPEAAMDSYSIGDDIRTGIPLSNSGGTDLRTALRTARRGRGSNDGDPVRIQVTDDQRPRVIVDITRDDIGLTQSTTLFGIDPDSCAQEPDRVDLSEHTQSLAAPQPDAIQTAIRELSRSHDILTVTHDGDDTLILTTRVMRDGDLDAPDDGPMSTVRLRDSVNQAHTKAGVPDASLFSMDYLDDIADGLKAVETDRLRIRFGDEVVVGMKWNNVDWGISGRYLLAPRIKNV